MKDIISYYLDIWTWLKDFFVDLYDKVLYCIGGGEVEQL